MHVWACMRVCTTVQLYIGYMFVYAYRRDTSSVKNIRILTRDFYSAHKIEVAGTSLFTTLNQNNRQAGVQIILSLTIQRVRQTVRPYSDGYMCTK